jgi:hypothetical protein
MVLQLVAAVALAPAAAEEPQVVSASLFKNGYAFVVREVPVRASGEVVLASIPQASLGSFWLTGSDGVAIDAFVNTEETVRRQDTLGTLDELLQANVGKRLKVEFMQAGKLEAIEGKLLSATGQIAIFERDGLVAIPKGTLVNVQAPTGELVYTRDREEKRRVLRATVRTSRPGTLTLIGLERGMTWAPTYAIDISNPKELAVTARATVINDLADIENRELRFITGFPNVPWATMLEPILSGHTVDQFTQMLGGVGIVAPGGMGGRREIMSQTPAAPAADFMQGFTPSGVEGVQAEDLFFYRQPNVTMKRGDRGYYVLFRTRSPFEPVHTWEIGDLILGDSTYRPQPESPQEVWHTIKFRNSGNHPWTTAPATVFKDGQIIGQDTMKYTPVGGEATVRLSKALNVQVDASEEETERQRNALTVQHQTYDRVTLQGTLVAHNLKPEPVKLVIGKDLTGEVLNAEGNPKITKIARGLRQVNPRGRIEWTENLKPGERRTLTYRYTVFIRG